MSIFCHTHHTAPNTSPKLKEQIALDLFSFISCVQVFTYMHACMFNVQETTGGHQISPALELHWEPPRGCRGRNLGPLEEHSAPSAGPSLQSQGSSGDENVKEKCLLSQLAH